MNTSYYRRRLEVDLPRWVAAGHVNADGMRAILTELDTNASGVGGTAGSSRMVSVLTILGAVLVGAGAISFVAANWQEMSRLFRLGLMGGSLWAAYGLAALLFHRGLDVFAHSAVLVGSAFFGASVMLVAQMYHLYGNPPDAVIVWAVGSLVAGLFFKSSPTVLLSLGLVCLWGGWETTLSASVFWPFLPVWSVVATVLAYEKCGYGVKIAVAVIGVWLVSIGYTLNGGHQHLLVVAIGAALGGFGFALQQSGPRFFESGRMAMVLGLAVGLSGLFALQFFERVDLGMLLIFAAVTIAVAIGAIAWGLRANDLTLTRVGYGGFMAEVAGLFIKTVGSLMGSSLFFVVTGFGVIGLAVLAYWVNMRMRQAKVGAGS